MSRPGSGLSWAPKFQGQAYVEALPLTNTEKDRRAARKYVARRSAAEGYTLAEQDRIYEMLGLTLTEEDR